ncbi:MAG: DUF4256 domain-containing protein [Spirochaetia bacterium]|nr:DUF4256 domain-containing protein [Spirochaetia bacterium]
MYTDFINKMKKRFENNLYRHSQIKWKDVEKRLINNQEKLISLLKMEETGGEPDVVFYDEESNEYLFFDCSKETPIGRRSLCYDRAALDSRKKNKPESNVMEMAAEIGIEVLDEEKYRQLQKVGPFDLKTSSWIKTPEKIRSLGGALFCDFRYESVFVYHNGADSYYSSRGFRGCLRV